MCNLQGGDGCGSGGEKLVLEDLCLKCRVINELVVSVSEGRESISLSPFI
jgi:hypothetical protein